MTTLLETADAKGRVKSRCIETKTSIKQFRHRPTGAITRSFSATTAGERLFAQKCQRDIRAKILADYLIAPPH